MTRRKAKKEKGTGKKPATAATPPVALSKPREIAAHITELVRNVGDYLAWNRLFKTIESQIPENRHDEVGMADWGKRLMEAQGHEADAGWYIRKYGPPIAKALDAYGFDITALLDVVFCAGKGGGGPMYLFDSWPKTRVALDRAAIQLENGTLKKGAKAAPPAPAERVVVVSAAHPRATISPKEHTEAFGALNRTDYEYRQFASQKSPHEKWNSLGTLVISMMQDKNTITHYAARLDVDASPFTSWLADASTRFNRAEELFIRGELTDAFFDPLIERWHEAKGKLDMLRAKIPVAPETPPERRGPEGYTRFDDVTPTATTNGVSTDVEVPLPPAAGPQRKPPRVTIAVLKGITGVSRDTLRRRAKDVEVKIAKQGGHHHSYSQADALKIVKQLALTSTNQETLQKCKTYIEAIQSTRK